MAIFACMDIIHENIKHIPILPELIRDEFDKHFYGTPPPPGGWHLFVVTGLGGAQAIQDHVLQVLNQTAVSSMGNGAPLVIDYPLFRMEVTVNSQFDVVSEAVPKYPRTGRALSSYKCDVYVKSEPAFRIQFVV